MDADDLRRLAGRTGFDLATLEKDYALSWLIQGIYGQNSRLAPFLIFKGGTAIRKVYYREWRLSEDLDFTILKSIEPGTVQAGFQTVFAQVERQSGISYDFKQYHERPYVILARAQFRGPLDQRNTIKVDISLNEKLVENPARVDVSPDYDDIPGYEALVYSLREILVEKLRSIMQRGYARDYYDVWRLLRNYQVDMTDIGRLLSRKCNLTDVPYVPANLFENDRLADAERHWEASLSRLTPDLPDFRVVIDDLRNITAGLTVRQS